MKQGIFFLLSVIFSVSNAFAAPGIAVMPFQSESPAVGEDLSGRLLSSLKSTNKFTLVERAQIQKALEEIARGQSGLIKEEDAPRIGEMAGAEYLVVGEIHRNETGYSASARVIKAETGIVIGAKSSQGNLEKINADLAEEAISALSVYLLLDNPDSPYTVLLKMDRGQNPVYSIGEKVKLTFKVLSHQPTAARQVYIQVYAINVRGEMTLIYPNKYARQMRIEVDREYTFPAETDDFEWELEGPPGTEYIQAIVTTQPVDFFNVNSRYLQEDFPRVQGNGRSEVTARSIVTHINHDKIQGWAAERISYQLRDD